MLSAPSASDTLYDDGSRATKPAGGGGGVLFSVTMRVRPAAVFWNSTSNTPFFYSVQGDVSKKPLFREQQVFRFPAAGQSYPGWELDVLLGRAGFQRHRDAKLASNVPLILLLLSLLLCATCLLLCASCLLCTFGGARGLFSSFGRTSLGCAGLGRTGVD